MVIFVLCLSLLAAGIGPAALAAPMNEPEDTAEDNVRTPQSSTGTDGGYDHYVLQYEGAASPDARYVLQGAGFDTGLSSAVDKLAQYEGKNDCAMMKSKAEAVWRVDIAEAGFYRIEMNYMPVAGKGRSLEMSLCINGEAPFKEADCFVFNRLWKDVLNEDGSFRTDSRGNELIPDQAEVFEWLNGVFQDSDGDYQKAFGFYLRQGPNEIALHNAGEDFVLESLCVYNRPNPPSYAENRPDKEMQTQPSSAGYFYKVQGEKPLKKSDKTLYPIYDRSGPDTEKSHPLKILRNTIGGINWSKPNQYIVWEIEVPEDGLYKIGIKYRQNLVRGLYAARKIYIDKKIPYAELENVRFKFCDVFSNYVLSCDGGEMLFYLTRGIHEIKMEVSLGELADNLRQIEAAQARLGEMYRKIIMVTGVAPDLVRDYDLEAEIPELTATLNDIAGSLSDQYTLFEYITQKTGNDAKLLKEMAQQLRSFVDKSYTIPERLESFRNNLSALASWILSIKSQPLEIDYIAVMSPEQSMPAAGSGFWNKMMYELRAFIGSFFTDYNVIGEKREGEKTIEVWVSTGREQSTLLKDLVDSSFYPQSHVNVIVKLVQGALMQSIMAGIGPDVALGLARTDPVNLALRSALEPLDGYEGYEKVAARFMPTAVDPYEFNGRHYALPETQSFHMMFYRTDIFEELGLEPPRTWDDFYRISSKVQRKNMEIGLPYAGSALTAESMSIFPTLLLQNGGAYYNSDKTRTRLSDDVSVETFIEWTQFYTLYSFPLVKDDYNRFRTGEMPLTIMPYTFYNQLQVAAPEIRNLWKMVGIPGTLREDGGIDRSEAATGSGSVILADAKNKEQCWEFLSWWTSAQIQAAYGNKIEMVLGAAGRYATANAEALSMLPWSDRELDSIKEQWRWVREVPEVPGGYYLVRNVDNAFRAVVLRNENARESLNYWNKEINKEIARKRKEYGLDGEADG